MSKIPDDARYRLDKLEPIVREAAKKFGTDIRIVGSIGKTGYSSHDIDLYIENYQNIYELGDIARFISERGNVMVEIIVPGERTESYIPVQAMPGQKIRYLSEGDYIEEHTDEDD